jgi:hypothetical protein
MIASNLTSVSYASCYAAVTGIQGIGPEELEQSKKTKTPAEEPKCFVMNFQWMKAALLTRKQVNFTV